jgi:Fe2+ or Zn2+ uptake regulation protein
MIRNQVERAAMSSAASSPDPLAHMAARCRELGVPLTVQRRAIYGVIAERHDHPTADEVFAALRQRLPGISKATAYRTLEKLVELGLVRRVSHPGAVARFDAKVHRHHHLVCERCGAVRDLESHALDAVALPDFAADGFQLRDFSVLIHGRCRACAQQRGADQPLRSVPTRARANGAGAGLSGGAPVAAPAAAPGSRRSPAPARARRESSGAARDESTAGRRATARAGGSRSTRFRRKA